MMSPYPFFGFPSFRRPYSYYPVHNPHFPAGNVEKNPHFPSDSFYSKSNCGDASFSKAEQKARKNFPAQDNKMEEEECFEIFGLKLHFDDLLLIALLFFLYQEEVKDTYLYIALILLLLS